MFMKSMFDAEPINSDTPTPTQKPVLWMITRALIINDEVVEEHVYHSHRDNGVVRWCVVNPDGTLSPRNAKPKRYKSEKTARRVMCELQSGIHSRYSYTVKEYYDGV